MALGVNKINLPQNNCHIWTIRLDQGRDCVLFLKRVLSPLEKLESEKFYDEIDQNRFIVGRSLLKILIHQYTSQEPATMDFLRTEEGKPHLADSALQFSKSASGEIGLVAFSQRADVGVDVEKTRRLADIEQLSRKHFAAPEINIICNAPVSDRPRLFFAAWTRKESVLKALGHGLKFGLDRFSVSLENSREFSVMFQQNNLKWNSDWLLRSWSPAPGYQAALALHSASGQIHFYKLTAA